MSLPPRQPRPMTAGGLPSSNAVPHEQLTPEDRMQRMFDLLGKVPSIPEPGAWAYVPVVGPAWETARDLQQGDYAGAAFNGAMLAAEFSPLAAARRAMKLVDAVNGMRRGAFLARAGTQTARIRKIEDVGKGFEVHHTIPMEGWGPIPKASREAEGLWRNHPANLKVMDKTKHRRLTGKWTDPGTGEVLERFDPVRRVWHGTNALQKSGAAATAATGADAVQNLLRWDDERRKR